MALRLALKSLALQPVRSAVLACGFGSGIAAMAGLLGIGQVVLETHRDFRWSYIHVYRHRNDSTH